MSNRERVNLIQDKQQQTHTHNSSLLLCCWFRGNLVLYPRARPPLPSLFYQTPPPLEMFKYLSMRARDIGYLFVCVFIYPSIFFIISDYHQLWETTKQHNSKTLALLSLSLSSRYYSRFISIKFIIYIFSFLLLLFCSLFLWN